MDGRYADLAPDIVVNLTDSVVQHVHKNFTVLGLFLHYVVGFIGSAVIYLLSYDIHWNYYKRDRKRVNMFVYTVRFVRIVHAAIATGVAVPIMLITTEFIKQRFLVLDMFVAISGGYLTFDVFGRYNEHLQVYEPSDCLVSYRIVRRFVKKNWMMLLHHIVLVCIIYPSVLFARDDEGDFLVACVLFTEFCVPFTESQWIMERTLEPHNLRYIVLSMCAISTSLVCRILIIPFMYEAMADHLSLSLLDFILSLAPWWHLAAVAYLVPNCLWLARNVFKTVVYLRIPYERRKKSKVTEDSALEREEKSLLKED